MNPDEQDEEWRSAIVHPLYQQESQSFHLVECWFRHVTTFFYFIPRIWYNRLAVVTQIMNGTSKRL